MNSSTRLDLVNLFFTDDNFKALLRQDPEKALRDRGLDVSPWVLGLLQQVDWDRFGSLDQAALRVSLAAGPEFADCSDPDDHCGP